MSIFSKHILLHTACDYGESLKVVETLVTAGHVDINSTFGGDNNCLMSLVLCEDPIILARCLMVACLLLASECHVNQESEDGYMALKYACKCWQDDELAHVLCAWCHSNS